MEPIVTYLEDAEKKLMMEMSELFSKMREQRNTISLEGIEEMYDIKPIEGILYEPCVRIPLTIALQRNDLYHCTNFTLPKDEYVICISESSQALQSGQSNYGTSYKCIALTNYGRCFLTKPTIEGRDGTYNGHSPHPTDNSIWRTYDGGNIIKIIKLEPLPYKMPSYFLKALSLGIDIQREAISNTTTSFQELNKEFYLFAGKWQPHITEYATIDIDTMRQTIINNTSSISELELKGERLKQQNKKLQAEITELKNQKITLEKEKAKLLPLEKYKEAVLEFMKNHYSNEESWDQDNVLKIFSNWYNDKVFMDKREHYDVMKSKEELNEYRIYKKVKGEMVSSGMDNSNVARNVRNIKKSVNELNTH
jgi:hypothetical protein